MGDSLLKGGLNYKINVLGDFKKLKDFEDRINRLKGKSKSGSGSAGGGGSGRSGSLFNQSDTVVSKALTAEQNKRTRLRSKEVQSSVVETKQAQITAKAYQDKNKVLKHNADLTDRSAAAEAANLKAAEKNLKIQDRIALARKRGIQSFAGIQRFTGLTTKQLTDNDSTLSHMEETRKKQLDIQKKQAAAAKKAIRDQEKLNKKANTFLYTFRRLVGILAVFTLARKLSAYIADSVAEMSRYNAMLETSRISIASIISATGQVLDAQGNVTTGAEEFNQALLVADKLTIMLRKDALKTTATFEDLLYAFQTAVGPGLSAGLGLQEIEAVSVNIARAATVLGVKTNQLSEEIRSLLTGMQKEASTRLKIIGITNEQIRQARKQGNLFELLSKGLEAFAVAGDHTVKTFEALSTNLSDVRKLLLAVGSEDYFNTLKGSMQAVFDSLTKINTGTEDGVGVNLDAVEGIYAVSTALKELIDDFRNLIDAENAIINVKNILTSIAVAIKIVSQVLVPVVVGFARALAIVSAIITIVYDLGRALLGIFPDSIAINFKNIAAWMLAIVIATKIWLKTLIIIKGGMKAVLAITALQKTASWAVTAATLVWEAAVAGVTVKAKILAGIMALWNLLMSPILLLVAAIAAILGFILVKTGALGSAWRKVKGMLSGSLDVTKEMEDRLNDMNDVIGNQVAGVEELDSAYESLKDQIKDTGMELKKALAIKNLTGNVKTIVSGLQDLDKSREKTLRKNNEKLDETRKKIKEVEKISDLYTEDTTQKMITALEEGKKAAIRKASTPKRKEGEKGYTPFLLRGMDTSDLSSTLDKERIDRAKKAGKILQGLQQTVGLDNSASALEVAKKISAAQREKNKLIEQETDILAKKAEYEAAFPALQQETLKVLIAQMDPAETLVEAYENQAKAFETMADASNSQQQADDFRLQAAKATQKAIALRYAQATKEVKTLDKLIANINANTLSVEDKQEILDYGIPEATIKKLTVSDAAKKEVMDILESESLKLKFGANQSAAELAAATRDSRIKGLQARGGVAGGFGDFAEGTERKDPLREGTGAGISEIVDSVSSGVGDAIRNGEWPDPAQTGIDVLATVIETMLAQYIANTILSLLGISTNNALLSVLNIEMTALTVSVNALTAAVIANTAVNAVPGLHAGGPVGFAGGGRVNGASGFRRGSHIDPRDTVAAWLQPGEYVLKKNTVDTVGADFLRRLDNGNVNLSAIKRMGMNKGGSVGFSGGGSVSAPTTSSGSSQREVIAIGMFPTSPANCKQIVRGGKQEVLRLIEQNPAAFKKALQI